MHDIPVILHSSETLQKWDHIAPWETGIGGSETEHCEMSLRLADKFDVYSYIPIPDRSEKSYKWDNVNWRESLALELPEKAVVIWHRDPLQLNREKPKGNRWWFIAQDVDYQFTEEQMDKIDRYICLCPMHSKFIGGKYPKIRNRLYQSSNGIRSDYLRERIKNNEFKRDPNRLFFPSSPDRGVKFLLQNWFRIREINPKAELYIAYGFDNMDSIRKLFGDDWRVQYKAELEELMKQDGIHFTGRLNQHQIVDHWLQTNIWAHPTDFPETSCITCMEAQALGAWPVTNNLWALDDNVKYGWMVNGTPQGRELIAAQWFNNLEKAFAYDNEAERKEMMEWTLDSFDWNNAVQQWSKWIEMDMESINAN